MLRKKLLSINAAFNLSFMMQLILVGIGCFIIYTTDVNNENKEIEKKKKRFQPLLSHLLQMKIKQAQ
jgi:hypothetical protein